MSALRNRLARFGASGASALTLAALAFASPVTALTAAEQCVRAKVKAASSYAVCRMKKEAYAIKLDREVDFTFCDAIFRDRWQRSESAAGGQCPTTGDEAAVLLAVAADMEDLAAALLSDTSGPVLATGQTDCYNAAGAVIPCAGTGQDGESQTGAARQYADNGDGTVSDLQTGLMWEKLSDDGSLHDVDDTYTWLGAMGGKAATANAQSFAGHSDWRVPTALELQTLVDFGTSNPSVDPVFNTNCVPGCTVLTGSCTKQAFHATSTPGITSFQLSTGLSWVVQFDDGLLYYQQEGNPFAARLVRGGS